MQGQPAKQTGLSSPRWGSYEKSDFKNISHYTLIKLTKLPVKAAIRNKRFAVYLQKTQTKLSFDGENYGRKYLDEIDF